MGETGETGEESIYRTINRFLSGLTGLPICAHCGNRVGFGGTKSASELHAVSHPHEGEHRRQSEAHDYP